MSNPAHKEAVNSYANAVSQRLRNLDLGLPAGPDVADLPDEAKKAFGVSRMDYNENQERDARGRFGAGGAPATIPQSQYGVQEKTEKDAPKARAKPGLTTLAGQREAVLARAAARVAEGKASDDARAAKAAAAAPAPGGEVDCREAAARAGDVAYAERMRAYAVEARKEADALAAKAADLRAAGVEQKNQPIGFHAANVAQHEAAKRAAGAERVADMAAARLKPLSMPLDVYAGRINAAMNLAEAARVESAVRQAREAQGDDTPPPKALAGQLGLKAGPEGASGLRDNQFEDDVAARRAAGVQALNEESLGRKVKQNEEPALAKKMIGTRVANVLSPPAEPSPAASEGDIEQLRRAGIGRGGVVQDPEANEDGWVAKRYLPNPAIELSERGAGRAEPEGRAPRHAPGDPRTRHAQDCREHPSQRWRVVRLVQGDA